MSVAWPHSSSNKSGMNKTEAYTTSEQQASQLSSKTHNIREKLGKLFGTKSGGTEKGSDDEEFQPTPNIGARPRSKRPNKGKQPMKSCKEKVKEIRMKVVGLCLVRTLLLVQKETNTRV